MLEIFKKLIECFISNFGQLQQMRKNLSKQFSKRPWKTPSPSYQSGLHSPRFNGNNRAPLLRADSSKQVKLALQNNPKPRQLLHTFKNHLVQLKHDTSKSNNQNNKNNNHHQQNAYNFNINDGGNQKYEQQSEKKSKNISKLIYNEQMDSYHSYFSKVSSAYNNIVAKSSSKQRRQKNKSGYGDVRITQDQFNKDKQKQAEYNYQITNKNNSIARNNSIIALIKNQQNQIIRKYQQQVANLKHKIREMQQNCQRINEYNKRVQQDLEMHKLQISNLKRKLQQRKYNDSIKNEQANKLKQQIQLNVSQLSITNFQLYKMKQHVFQNEMTIQKMRGEIYRLQQQSQLSQLQQKQKASKIAEPSYCETCRYNQKIIIALNNAIENKMLEIGKKDKAIQGLCADLQKLQIQFKMYQKPKIFAKKLIHSLEMANEVIIVQKLKLKNEKYKNI